VDIYLCGCSNEYVNMLHLTYR